MQLYSAAISPYASRCRIQVHHKGLPVEIVPPPGGMRSAQVLALNPIGKIPVLDLGGDALFESWAIMEYLEARFPQVPMRPADPLAAGKLAALVRFADIQLALAMFPMFRALRGAAGADAVAEAVAGQDAQLQVLEQLLARKASGLAFDLADAALLPIVYYARLLGSHFARKDVLAALPATQRWWQAASAVPAAARVLAEMDAGLRAAIPALFASQAVTIGESA